MPFITYHVDLHGTPHVFPALQNDDGSYVGDRRYGYGPDPATAAQFARTVNALKGRATMLFIAHQLPKGLAVDEVVDLAANVQAPVGIRG